MWRRQGGGWDWRKCPWVCYISEQVSRGSHHIIWYQRDAGSIHEDGVVPPPSPTICPLPQISPPPHPQLCHLCTLCYHSFQLWNDTLQSIPFFVILLLIPILLGRISPPIKPNATIALCLYAFIFRSLITIFHIFPEI